ncbi:putative reverse transcriptase domain-containing protein [Tanacetum coccineum]
MSDESTVTYTEVSSPFEGLSDIRSPGVAPPSPDYIPGPEEPQSPPLPDFVPEPVYPEYMPQEDEVFLAEEQPLPTAASPTAQSPDYVPESNPEEDPEEDDDEDPKEDPVDYPADGRDDGNDKDESSEDDDDVDIEADDDDEEEEHPSPADSTAIALPAADQAPSAKETEPFETDESAATPPPHPAYRVTARISIPAPVPTPVWSDVEIPFPPLPLIPSPSLPLSPPLPISAPPPASPIRPLGYRAAMIRLRAEAASTSYLLPLPPPIILSHTRLDAPSSGTPPLLLPFTNRREDRPEVTLPPQKRLGIALGPTYEVGESSSVAAARPDRGLRADYGFVATMDRDISRDLERDVGYGITDSWDEIVEAMQGTPVVTDVAEFSQRITEFETRVRDRRAHAHTARLMETEARISQETEAVHRDTEADKETSDLDDRKMAPKRRTMRLNPETTPAATAATTTTVTNAQLQAMIDQGATAVLAARDANTNGIDSHNSGTGVVELTQWIEKMETVFCISNYFVENQIKFSTCTLLGNALTWWNSHVRTVGNDIAYAMTWTELKKKMTDKYCPRIEIKKLKVELWELKVKGTDVIGYNQRFQELALLCGRMFPEESDKIEKYVGGLPDMIHGSVVASKPKTMQEATEMAIEVMDKRIRTFADRTVEKKQYGGSKPLCSKCNYHHDGSCAPKCHKCNKVVQFARNCRSTANANNANNQKGTGSGQKPTCYDCGVQGHFKRECPKLKNNNNRGNQVGGGNAPAKVYAVGHAGTNLKSNVVMANKMAEENVHAPTRTDEQLVPVKQRLPIRKSNLLMDLQKMQKNPIFRISVDILKNTNFFRAFTTSADVPSIYIQQFWNTLAKDTKIGKTSGGDKPRHPVLQMLWGVVTGTNVNYGELIWEEFIQAIRNFFSDMANL